MIVSIQDMLLENLLLSLFIFDPSADDHTEPIIIRTTDESLDSLNQYVNYDEKIERVEVHSCPYYYFMPSFISKKFYFHTYVVFLSSGGHWWSLEHTKQGLVAQRTKHKHHLLEKFVRQLRPQYKDSDHVLKRETGRVNLLKLFKWLFLRIPNHQCQSWYNDCSLFTDDAFDLITKPPESLTLEHAEL